MPRFASLIKPFLGASDEVGGFLTGLSRGGKYTSSLDDLARTENIIKKNISSPDNIRMLGKANDAPSSLRNISAKLDEVPSSQRMDLLNNELGQIQESKKLIDSASSPSNIVTQMNKEFDEPLSKALFKDEDRFGSAFGVGEGVRKVGANTFGNPIVQGLAFEIPFMAYYTISQPSQEELMQQQLMAQQQQQMY